MRIFHGTSPTVAASLAAGGVDVTQGGGELGVGFYTGEYLHVAKAWAIHRYGAKQQNVVEFDVDDHDVLAEPEDLVRLRDVLEMNFQLLKKPVETVAKTSVGKVGDYAVETTGMYVQKLYVSRPFWQNLAGGTLSVDRSQVVEVTNKRIVINDLLDSAREPQAALAA